MKKIDAPMFLYWPDLPKMATIYVIRTKRKTVELSMTHLMQIIARVPLDYPIVAVQEQVFRCADDFKHHALITVLREMND